MQPGLPAARPAAGFSRHLSGPPKEFLRTSDPVFGDAVQQNACIQSAKFLQIYFDAWQILLFTGWNENMSKRHQPYLAKTSTYEAVFDSLNFLRAKIFGCSRSVIIIVITKNLVARDDFQVINKNNHQHHKSEYHHQSSLKYQNLSYFEIIRIANPESSTSIMIIRFLQRYISLLHEYPIMGIVNHRDNY